MSGTVAVEAVPSLAPDQRREIVGLLAATEAIDGYDALSDEARLELSGTAPAAPVVLARADDGRLVGLAATRGRPEHRTVEVAIHPSRRDGTALAALLDGVVAEVGARRGGDVTLWLRGGEAGRKSAREVERRGLRWVRDLLQLRADLPIDAARDGPAPRTRAFLPGEDEAAWLAVNNRAFAGHPEQSGWKMADLVRRERESWFDPEGFLLYEEGGRLAGFCWTKVHPPATPAAPTLGEIYVIGIDPDFQGRGLGRTLTVAGLRHLVERGLRTAMLYVEATNDAALGLYRSLGFTVHHTERAYRGSIYTPDTPTARPMP